MSLLISTLLVSLTIKVQAVGTTVFPFEDKCRMRPGLWSCTDCQKCTSFETCDVEEAIYRAGYSCHEWPYLNAVAPAENKLFLPVESKTITCANTTLSGCTVWDETKRSSTSLATTTCTCADYRSTGGNDYCHNWTCFGVGLTLCKQGTDCGAYQHYGQISYYQDCCYQTCESSSSNSGSSHRSGSGGSSTTTTSCIDHQDPKEFHYEFQECQCTDPQVGEQSTDGLTIYCANWQCVDYSSDDPAGSYIAHTGYFEYEKHNCKVRHVDGYCQLWNWQTDDYKQFQNTECTCAMTHFQNGTSGPKVCTQWDCTEKGAKKIEPNLLWSLFGLCFGGIFIVVLNVIKYGDNAASRYCVAFLFANLIVTVPLLLGGLGSLFFVLIIGAPLAFAQFWYSTFKGDSAIIRLNLGLPPGPNDRTKVAPDSGNTMASNTTGVEVMPQGIKVAPDLQPVQYAQVAQPVQYTQVAQPVQYAQIQGQPQYQQVGQMQNLYQQQMQQPQYQQQVQGQPQYQQSPQYQQMQGQPQYQQAPQYQQMQGQPQYQQAPQYQQMQGQPQYQQAPQYEQMQGQPQYHQSPQYE